MKTLGTVRLRYFDADRVGISVYSEHPVTYNGQHYSMQAAYQKGATGWSNQNTSLLRLEPEAKRASDVDVALWVGDMLADLLGQAETLRAEDDNGASIFCGFVNEQPWFALAEQPDQVNEIGGIARAGGDARCTRCSLPYRRHPSGGPLGDDGHQFLNLLCDGRLVKL